MTDGWISNLDPRAETGSEIQSLYKNLDANFLLSSAYLVFFMQAGFAMLCAGSVRSKNTKNILIKNVLDACVGALAWFYLGYGFAFGKPSDETGMNSFIGSGNFAMKGVSTQKDIAMYLFQWSFSAAATTIVSGSVAERTKFEAYLGSPSFSARSSTRSSCTGAGPVRAGSVRGGVQRATGVGLFSPAVACSISPDLASCT